MAQGKENVHAGHRKRMREKLAVHGDGVFHTYEILEMLLYHAVPCKNTNEQAKSLIKRFGSIDGVFSATREQLLSVPGVGDRIADIILAAGRLDLRNPPAEHGERRRFCDYKLVGEHFVKYFSDKKGYSVVMLMLDNKMEAIATEELYSIDFSSGAVRSEKFIKHAVHAGCSVAMIAHNHPYGPAFPSEGDIVTNAMICRDMELSGITLAEHYLVSGDRFVGFMSAPPADAFSQTSPVMAFYESKEGCCEENA